MAAILVVAGGWSLAAKRAAHYRLAYTLASAALGEVGHLALIVPMAILRDYSVWQVWLNPGAVLLMTASTVLAAAILRRRILAWGEGAFYGAAIGSMYLTSVIFPILWGVAFLAMEPGAGLVIILFGFIFGPLLATLTSPLVLPMSMAFCWVLRCIDPWRS
jgi:hypothetical protein